MGPSLGKPPYGIPNSNVLFQGLDSQHFLRFAPTRYGEKHLAGFLCGAMSTDPIQGPQEPQCSSCPSFLKFLDPEP